MVLVAVGTGHDRGAQVQVGPPGSGDVGPQPGRLAVTGPGHDRRAGRDADLGGDLVGELAQHLAGRMDLGHLLAGQPGRAKQLVGPVEGAQVDQPERVGRGPGGLPLVGHPVDQEGMHIHHLARPVQGPRLVLPQPQQLVEAGGRVGRLAGNLVDLVRAVLGHLRAGPGVQPQDRRPDRAVVLVQADEGLALVGDPDGADLIRVHGPGRLAQRIAGRAPPVLGVLLAPAGLGG
jgi:hypothetical protein